MGKRYGLHPLAFLQHSNLATETTTGLTHWCPRRLNPAFPSSQYQLRAPSKFAVSMAKSSRARRIKANNRRLKKNVFSPVEDARVQRLHEKLLEIASQPKPARPVPEEEMADVQGNGMFPKQAGRRNTSSSWSSVARTGEDAMEIEKDGSNTETKTDEGMSSLAQRLGISLWSPSCPPRAKLMCGAYNLPIQPSSPWTSTL